MRAFMHGASRRAAPAILLSVMAGSLSACAWIGDQLGVGKDPPDAFVVVDKRPLVVPPDFKLRPPEPGKPSPQNIQPAEEVVSALFPGVERVPDRPSRGEAALLANVETPSVNVRSSVDGETEVVDKGQLLVDILALQPRELESDGAIIARGDTPSSPEDEEDSSGFFAWLFGK